MKPHTKSIKRAHYGPCDSPLPRRYRLTFTHRDLPSNIHASGAPAGWKGTPPELATGALAGDARASALAHVAGAVVTGLAR